MNIGGGINMNDFDSFEIGVEKKKFLKIFEKMRKNGQNYKCEDLMIMVKIRLTS